MKSYNLENFFKYIDKPPAFVLGGSAVGALGVIRNLAKMGIPTVALDSDRNQIFLYSRYCQKIICPNPKKNEKAYIDFLLTIGEELNIKGVLIPTGDIETLVTLKHRKSLEKYYKFISAELDVAEKLLDKRIFYETLKSLEIPHAKTYFPKDISTVQNISERITYPCIVKPSFSAHFTYDFHTKLFLAKSKDELIMAYNRAIKENHDVIIQEIIPGEESYKYGFNAYYTHNFDPIGSFAYRRIRGRPHMFGVNCAIQNVRQPELEDIITPLIKNIKYYGIVDAEFKKDPRDGLFKLIEINPRAWMQISLPTRCGINIAYIAYMNAINENIDKVTQTKEGVKWFNMFEDIESSARSILKRELSLHEWINSYKGEKEFAVFKWDDPLPFFVSFALKTYQILPYAIKQSKNH